MIEEFYLIQEKIEYANEAGVFYCRYPNDEKGKITNIKTSKSPGKEVLENEAYRVASLIPSMAFPGHKNGNPVKVKYSVPITFKIQ